MKLTLSAEANNWEQFKRRQQSTKFKIIRDQLISRDNFHCQFCGFISGSLEMINFDNNYNNNRKSNLLSACVLCSHCCLLDRYPIDYDGNDKIIYLPELTQANLNQLVRVLFCNSKFKKGDACYNAQMAVAQLQDRAALLDKAAGMKLSNPALFVHYQSMEGQDKSLINKLRWLPAGDNYEKYLTQWQTDLELSESDIDVDLGLSLEDHE